MNLSGCTIKTYCSRLGAIAVISLLALLSASGAPVNSTVRSESEPGAGWMLLPAFDASTEG